MDRSSLIGVGLIGVIFIGWLWWIRPSEEELAKQKKIQDSLALVESKKQEEIRKAIAKNDSSKSANLSFDTLKPIEISDSTKMQLQNEKLRDSFKDFAIAATGKEEFIVLENNLIKVKLSTKGGRVAAVELKNYSKPDKSPVTLFNPDSTRQSLIFNAYSNLNINTENLFFTPVGNIKDDKKPLVVEKNKSETVRLRLNTSIPNSFIEYVYTLKDNEYILSYDVNFNGLESILGNSNSEITLDWSMALPTQESHISKERQTATVYFRNKIDSEVDYINPNSDEEKSITETELNWVAFKHQFFSCVLISDKGFSKGTKISTLSDKTSAEYVKRTSALLGFPYGKAGNEQHNFKFYFGPNHYYTLKDQGMGLEEVIPVGWSIFSYINKWIVIPVFNSFKNSSFSYGWVILILTVIIKILLFPIAYKTYISSTKMRLLKPEIDVINAKFANDPMKKNQETMGLYSKAGASPLSGCIPALIQLPILIALFNFFPASIELRQEEFLWANDLSTYDSIWTFGYVPVIDWIYGDHVSLFALLMFLSTIAYTWMNQKMMPMNNQQMPGMQTMMYLMPLIFLSFMNSYSAGLSWYYFLANMITFGQTFLMRKMVSDDKLRAKLEENMKKPRKLSGFQQRLEEMAKKQQQKAKR